METSEAFFRKNLGLGMDWFTLLIVNSEKGGDDSVTVKEKKLWEGEDEVVSDDTSVDAPLPDGGGTQPFPALLLPKKVAAHFPHNKAHVASYLIIPKTYCT